MNQETNSYDEQDEYRAQELDAVRNPELLAQERRASEEEAKKQQQKKDQMGWLVFIFALLLSIIADLIEIFTVGTIGWLTGLFIDFILFVTLGFTRAGRKQWKKLVSALFIESVPILNILPLRTILLTWSFIASRPKLMSRIEKGLKIASYIPSPVSAELKVASKAFSVAASIEKNKEAPLIQKLAVAKSALKLIKR
ncbi:MAG: hypothetical protein HYX21_02045 [Candidatus Yanofskybacteria bacterium]|nr:hypothetical protein [Candidatus Yanofskybacteria bacterium]